MREKSDLERAIGASPPALQFSHPKFLVARWERNFGREAALELCRWNNLPAEIFLRTNTLKVTSGELERAAPDATRVESHPLLFRAGQVPFLWLAQGLAYVQDPSTLIAPELLDPQPGERVLDACAAPGGKTSYLAQLMGNEGEIVACDVSKKRLTKMEENLGRLGVANVQSRQHDWLAGSMPDQLESFDRILVDAPCSNTGVIRRRVDVRWRLSAEDFTGMPRKQWHILKSVVPLLKKGGTLVYSTCSLEPEENEQLLARISAELPELEFVESRQSLPFRDGMDGAFAAKFVRR